MESNVVEDLDFLPIRSEELLQLTNALHTLQHNCNEFLASALLPNNLTTQGLQQISAECAKFKIELEDMIDLVNHLQPHLSHNHFYLPHINQLHNTYDNLHKFELNFLNSCKSQSFNPEEINRKLCMGNSGRLRFDLNLNDIHQYIEDGHTTLEISKMTGVSISTITRRKREWGIFVRQWTNISNLDLDAAISRIHNNLSHSIGVIGMLSHLTADGTRVPRERVRESLRRIDPAGVVGRLLQCTHRRRYSVPYPNSLWHIDGYHKLIRWKFVIHGGIDGYSRLIVYMAASDNNLSESVGRAFTEAVREWGWPSRVRADCGTENVVVQAMMTLARGEDRGSFLKGKSVHNQRIERLWGDLWKWNIQKFYHLFYDLEAQGLLDIDNEICMYSLHYIYLPYIKAACAAFVKMWNRHGIRTAKSKNPRRLFRNGLQEALENGMLTDNYIQDDDILVENYNLYGVQLHGRGTHSDIITEQQNPIVVEVNHSYLSTDEYNQLLELVPIPQESCILDDTGLGVELYLRAVKFIASIRQSNA